MKTEQESKPLPEQAVAIIGMAGRFPGAANVDELWQNLIDGKDTITRFSAEESQDRRAGDHDADGYVAARGVLDDVECFDAEYFGILPREAERIDPQHRVFLETCATALEDAGYVAREYTEEIGLFAGCSLNTYLLANLCADRAFIDELTSNYQVGEFASALGNDKDFLTTRVAYKLNLRGPCMTVQGACATSLVAVAQACQSLLTYQCSMALAGGVSITFPQHRGHVHQDGAISSKDGLCKPFDADASGTVFGHGAGVVVLKRLEDAVRDGDHIEAVIRGFAVNNDGAEKAGYMAPGVSGQVRVIAMAHAMAAVSPDTITYIEAHGTGTPVGDPIEIAALTEAFQQGTDRTGFCTVGSIKANIGHLDSAAGISGLIKTTLALKHRTLPGLLHFESPNQNLSLEGSPFVFTSQTKPWIADTRRAGVSAFGVGGVNAHIVLEEAPAVTAHPAAQFAYPLCLSARAPETLMQMREELAQHLEANPQLAVADVAYTLACGRESQVHRFCVAVATLEEAIAALRGNQSVSSSEAASLATQWVGGQSVNWHAFFAVETRQRVSLPTTIFRKSVHWIEPPAAVSIEQSTAAPASEPVMTEPVSRLARLEREVSAVLFDLSGIEVPETDVEVSFFELGFDSLFLTQATSSLERTFGVKVSFRQLMEDLDTVRAMALYLDQTMPPEIAQPAPVAVSPPAPQGAVEEMLAAQITQLSELFKGQVDALRQAAGLAPLATKPAPALQAASQAVEATAPLRHGSFRVPQTRSNEPITPKQSAYIAELVAKYTAKTPSSKQKTQQSRAYLADPRAVAGFRPQWKEMVYPIVTDSAKGSRLWDIDGNEYIDIVNGYGCIMFGHSPEFVVEAVRRQIDLGVAIGPQSHLAGEVAALIAQMTGNDRVTFCNTGSEAVMAAMRVARMVTGRDRVVYFAGDYHGTFDEVLARATPRGTTPIAPGIPAASMTNIVVLPYGTDESLQYLREHGNEIAAVLVEPVQTRHPELQPVEFLRTVRSVTESTGTAMIIDEVVTGFRLSPGGVQAEFGIRADLCTYGKVLGGGYPIGVLSGKSRFMDALDGGAWQYGDESVPEAGVTFFAGTFVRHPQALAAAHAVLQHLIAAGPELQKTLNEKAYRLAASIDNMFVSRGIACRVHAFASWFYFVFPPEAKLASLFYYSMRAKGIHIQESYPCFLTTAHSDADLAEVERCFETTIQELYEAGILHGDAATQQNLEVPVSVATPENVTLTEAQREIFLAAALSDEANCAFNESLTLRLHGPMRKAALQFALDTILARHHALRAVVAEDGERLHFDPVFRGEVEWLDLSTASAEEQQATLSARIFAEAARPFSLHGGPLVRLAVFAMGPDETVVLLTAHHIVLDGWSSNQFVEEVGTLYSGGHTALATLPHAMQFHHYAQRELDRRAAGDFAANERYWVGLFENRSPRLNLPTDRPRPEDKTYNGATLEGTLDATILEGARQLGRKNGSSLFMTLLSAFQILLHRLTQQKEVVVGISTAGQALLDGKVLIGHCVNFLPMLSEWHKGETVQEHLRATRTRMLDAQEHQEFTYGSLLQKLKLERDNSRLPLVEVQFNLEKAGNTSSFQRLTAESHSNPKRFVNTDLFLNLIETPAGMSFTLDYNTDLFDEATMSRWMGYWSQLLVSEAAAPNASFGSLPMLDAASLEHLLQDANQTAVDFGPFESTPSAILRWAATTPQAIAVECNGRSWTYTELAEYASILARRLLHEGLQPGALVGICIERSLEMAGALVAVMLAGGVYVPLDPRHPHERLEAIVGNAGIDILLTGRDPILTVGKTLNISGPQPVYNNALPAACHAEDLAYVIYTSGSTGVPKGVAIEHGALFNLLKSMQRAPGMQAEDSLLAVTTLAFDIATMELLLPLITGARLVIATDEEATDGMQLLRLIHEKSITVMQATPGLWRIVIDAGIGATPSLTILCGGEALPRDLADQLLAISPSVWNVYGPTETTIWSAAGLVLPGNDAPPIGPPVANTQLYVLGLEDQPVPRGVVGELVIAGDGLARGYWKQPALTAEKFLPNPFGPGRLYRTGDLARQRPDGRIEILGRSDFQVKVRGYRIELGDIEVALRRHSEVRDAVVVMAQAAGANPALAAFVEVPQLAETVEQQTLSEELRSMLHRTLPPYMVPDRITLLAQLPRTPNGKIDRKQLSPASSKPARERVVTPPATPEEEKLVAIWAEVLHLDAVSTTDSIFELGADSLAIFRIAAKCQRDAMPVKAVHIFKYRTIVNLAAELLQKRSSPVVPASPRITAASRERFKLKR